uniref:C2 domain-containing protein n=1 Tax=Fagus sylvatica TaxID=28930 RepID=A0A2N9J6J4_FAGSY
MGYRSLEIVIQSAQELKYVNHVKKMKPYAVVFICDDSNNPISSLENTAVDSDGDSNPKWNFPVKFNINIAEAQKNSHVLVVKLKSHHKTHSDKDIGEVRVPIAELLEGFGDADAEEEDDDEKQVMSKNVVTSDGMSEEGTLAFSYNFGRTVEHPPNHCPPEQVPEIKSRSHNFKIAAKVFVKVVVGGLAQGLGVGGALVS